MQLFFSYLPLIFAGVLIGLELQSWAVGSSVVLLGQFYMIASGLPKE